MFHSKKNREANRYYLLPGMARSNRRKHAQTVRWSIVFGILTSAVLGTLLYYFNRF